MDRGGGSGAEEMTMVGEGGYFQRRSSSPYTVPL